MRISEVALHHKNITVARKHTQRAEQIIHDGILDDEYFCALKSDFYLTASKFKFTCGELEPKSQKKSTHYISAWKIAEDLTDKSGDDPTTRINAKYHVFDVTQAIKSAAEASPDFLTHVISDEFVLNSLEMRATQELYEALGTYSIDCLRTACELGTDQQMAQSYTRLGKYCYQLLGNTYTHNSQLAEEFISSILTGMSLGSLEAAHYFPCLLKQDFYSNSDQAEELFLAKCEEVPSWLFLQWQAQIMSYLGKPLARLLVPIVQRLIKDYPNGVMYNFRQTCEAQPELRDRPEIREMYETLFADSRIETLFEAMNRVCQPEHYLRYHLEQLLDSREDLSEAIDGLLERVFNERVWSCSSVQGPLFKVLDKYRSELEKLKDMDREAATKYANGIISRKLHEAIKLRLQSAKLRALQLKDYSPYLSQFSGEDFEIEVPGQYRGDQKPLPRYHTKIAKFDRFVRVMESKCNPIKISLVGDDSKTYGFLVKFGEDLRQDQRLQQIFRITNKTLRNDTSCKRRYLSINTYDVVPLSTSLGLIQWVDGTKSLREFVEFSMPDKSVIETVANEYGQWIEKAGRASGRVNSYKLALDKYNPSTVIAKMRDLVGKINRDYLRKTFTMLSPSLQCFVSLRHNFITSYSTMCLAHWICGVGDRHLENTLIEVKTGKCYGIDFGLAFGAGIDQWVPELVPFRLTAQILGLLRPFDEQALFGVTMTHVLAALRKERGPIMACLNVFIHEPLDWSRHVNKNLEADGEEHLEGRV